MISRIFIDRPVFAWVIAILIMLVGGTSLIGLPVAHYPDVAPPSVNIQASYPGASAETVESNVTQVIEQQLTGLDGMIYFQANSNSNGRASINVFFEKGVDPDIAQVQVQNKVQQALPRLPQQVQQQGLVVTKSNPDFLMVIAISDLSDRTTSRDISDYLTSTLQDGVGRVPGVGETNVFGAPYAMRIWMDPFKLAGVKLMPEDVISAIQSQNAQVAAGQIGGQPAPDDQMLNAVVTSRTRFTNVDQFKSIVLKTRPDGSKVRLQDVARVELGSENYVALGRINRHPAAGLAVLLAPGADALKTSELVRAYVEEQAKSLPASYSYDFLNDSSRFIRLSIHEVVITLGIAIVLVVLVMFVFLQSWRATLIPAIAVPVVLLGTFGVLAAAGYSINTLTLFGLVLAIGLLVDDAIVVVENVERVMEADPDITPREATIKSMAEINTALIAIAMVLSAVFLPMAFFGGSTGVIYRQFSLTIIASMVLSVFVALILSPALAATLLKRTDKEAWAGRSGLVGRAHDYGERFSAWFKRMSDRYRDELRKVIARTKIAMVVFVVVVAALVFLFLRLPTGFVPNEDMGLAQIQITLPAGGTTNRTEKVAQAVEDYFDEKEKGAVASYFVVRGQSFGSSGQNAARGFIGLRPWDDRPGKQNEAQAMARRATMALNSIRDAQIFVLTPPSVPGLGFSGGFAMELLNTGGLSQQEFKERRDQVIAEASADPALAAVRANLLDDAPTLAVDLDTEKIGALGLGQAAVNQTLSAAWGGIYVNDFIDRGRVKRVFVQGDAPFRMKPDDLGDWRVRSSAGEMVPFSAFATTRWEKKPGAMTRFNGTPNYQIQGQGAPGVSSGDAMQRISDIASRLPGVSVAWSGLSYQERAASGQAPILYLLSIIVVFLCLAALYESWSIPLAVIMVIPLGLVGATLAVILRGLENDVFFQVGLVTTMGLSAKNAILIIEFAEQAEKEGKTPLEAAIEAAHIRIRPIMMTSIAFMFGVLPLALASGAGANARVAIGTAVLGGMITATAFAIFYVPVFYVLVRKLFGSKQHTAEEQA